VKDYLPKARKITAKVKICNWCLGRQFTTKLKDAPALGTSLGSIETNSCEFCGGAYTERVKTIQDIITKLAEYEIRSIQIGVIVPKHMIDREDEMRSKLRLNTGVGIKKALVSLYRSELRSRLPQIFQTNLPDVFVKIDLEGNTSHIESKSVSYLVRYVKLERGIRTRSKVCERCGGVGCEVCSETGLESNPLSVEFLVVRQFKRAFAASRIRISWSGTDDEESIVNGSGRPIFVQVLNPMHRYTGISRLDRMVGGPVQLTQVEEKELDTSMIVGLKKLVKYTLETSHPWVPGDINIESMFRNRVVPSASKNLRRVYWLKVVEVQNSSITMIAYMDNGISPWNLLKWRHSEQDAELGVLEALGSEMVTKYTYDVLDFRQD
jgi:tRNA pseudouridine synthase 10